ncbi:MAG: PrsW family intramembrane metalloprotease [Solobacterium sp.]|nr:PrsW family intramembrane metalloprotease [Solobacterium sp.]MBQ6531933.1 PrsW family intramembrane metalloprotease [Solobacterium sp.]MBR0214986.1 PrsW family intramembrane metalloprotease [Solobacterium sp.]
MTVLIIAFLASLIPAVIIYIWLRDHMFRHDQEYTSFCRRSLLKGMLSTFLVILFSGTLSLLGNAVLFRESRGLLHTAYRTFIVLALAEEAAKYITFRRLLKKSESPYSALDMISSMILVGLGFEILESGVYALTTSPGQMLVRGVTAMHAGYGFIMGYFMAKNRLTGKKSQAVLGFMIPALLHGAYDFGLSDEFAQLGDTTAILSVTLAAFALVTLIWMFLFTRKARTNPVYTDCLPAEEPAADN